ncbi:MAG: hypothetical protein HC828_14090 [Blastochloris sp.]|nr:hypothetical protein [Blastochloris sp.]
MPINHAPQLLYATPNGLVLRCPYCQDIPLVFGNLVIVLQPPAFVAFADFIEELDIAELEAANRSLPHPRKVMAQIPDTTVLMAFYPAEIEELRRLLHGALQIMQTPSLLARSAAAGHQWN